MRIGYIGIGIMGCGIVKNLQKAGHPVLFTVHRDRSRVPELRAAGAVESPDYAAMVSASEAIMLTVPDSSAVEQVLGVSGIGPHLRSGQIVVDMSTSYPGSTRSLSAALEAKGVVLLDAPLTGSRPEAESGRLHVMCGGPRDTFERVKPLFEAIAADVFHVGPVGAGHSLKLINNYLGQIGAAAISEVLPFASRAGIDLQSLFQVISVSGGNSSVFQGLLPRVMNRDFGVRFQQKYVHKDIRYMSNIAREAGVPMPLAAALLAIHDMAGASGYGEHDFSSLVEFWENMSGAKIILNPGKKEGETI